MRQGRTPNPANRLTATCPTCGEEFSYFKSEKRIYCSAECRNNDPGKWTESPCPECGTVIRYLKSWPRKYCSLACSSRANIARQIPDFRHTAIAATCEQCGASFEASPSQTRGRFCSQRCFGDWLSLHNRGESHPSFGVKRPRLSLQVMKVCPVCEKTFGVKPSQAERRRYCSKACQGADFSRLRSGENSPTWRGGYLPYYGPTWRPARRAVLRRDKVCQDCGKSPEDLGRELDVHHIIPFRSFGLERHAEANALTNLIGLCNVCHLNREWKDNGRGPHA